MLPGIPGIYTTKQLAYSLSACVGFFTFHSSPFVFIVVTCTFQFNSWKASFPQWSSGQAVVTGGALFPPPLVGSIHFAFIPTARRFMHTSWGSIHSAFIPTACRFMHTYDAFEVLFIPHSFPLLVDPSIVFFWPTRASALSLWVATEWKLSFLEVHCPDSYILRSICKYILYTRYNVYSGVYYVPGIGMLQAF